MPFLFCRHRCPVAFAAWRPPHPPPAGPHRPRRCRHAQVNIQELGVYGEDHMLVQKARELYEEVARRPLPAAAAGPATNSEGAE